MSDEPVGPSAAAPQGTTDRHSPGQLLKKERERRGLSIQQAAEDLNLDRWIVEAIEADNFVALGAPVFARGHLRKYATLLEVSGDVVVGRYDALSGTPTVPVVTPTATAQMRVRRRARVYVLPVLLIATLLFALLWLLRR
jgi:cytoskeleton protein RodZ